MYSNNNIKFPKHISFDILKEKEIKDHSISVALYKHRQTGSEILSIATNDENKVFGITFRTPPNDSTGLPHILEHSVLCGSRKYQSKEPFVDLMKGSLNTFLNAFTYPDRTCYPVASMNNKDFYNLVDVYLDAVFYPRAINDSQVFQQEGWHYEYDEKLKELSYKGVVYNEMKGVYSTPDALMGRITQQTLFPDNTYNVDSGGDPNIIPNLTFEQFQAFHSSTYHPSNSRTFFYGNDDLLKRLEIIDEYFKNFQFMSTNHTKIAIQTKKDLKINNNNNEYLEMSYPSSGENLNNRMFTINWLLNEKFLTNRERMELSILNHLLIGTTASDLYKVLIDSKLGESVTGGGISEELQQATFSIGMKGVNYENITKLDNLIYNTLLNLSETGFSNDAINSSLNTYEFQLREFNTGGYPKGLSFMLECLNHWIYDHDPLTGLEFEESIQSIKNDLKLNKPIFQELLKKYLLNNQHKIKIIMKPDSNLEENLLNKEKENMNNLKNNMTEKDLELIKNKVELLRKAQEKEDTPEAKATIPRLTLNDIDRNVKEIPTKISKLKILNDITILEHNLPSSGILYTEIGFDFSRIPLEDIKLLTLFSTLLMDSGTKTRDQVSLSRYIGSTTGGIDISWYTDIKNIKDVVSDPNNVLLYLMINGKCTVDKIPELFDIIGDILLNAKLDNQKRALEMLLQRKSRRVSSVTSNGHRFAAIKAASKSSFLGYFNENTGGLTALQGLDELIDQVTNNWDNIHNKLENIRQIILDNIHLNHQQQRENNNNNNNNDNKPTDRVIINLTGDQELIDSSKIPLTNLFTTLSNYPLQKQQKQQNCLLNSNTLVNEWKLLQQKEQKELLNNMIKSYFEGYIISSQVNYVIQSGYLFKPFEKINGSSVVIAKYLSNGYLWDNVRVIGGAYGSYGSLTPSTGRFTYSSYRDPNIIETFKIYQNTYKSLDNITELSFDEILHCIIGTIGDLDTPLFVDQKGELALRKYLRNDSLEEDIKWRNEILNTSKEDFILFQNKLKELHENPNNLVVFGSKSQLNKFKNYFENESEIGKNKIFEIYPTFEINQNEEGGEEEEINQEGGEEEEGEDEKH